MSDETGDKTEPASPERRRKAKEQGDVAKAKDAGGVAAGVGVLLVLSTMGAPAVKNLAAFAIRCFSEPFDLVGGNSGALALRTTSVLATLAMPSAVAAAVAATGIAIAQVGFNPRFDLLMPKPGRINPAGKLKSLFTPIDATIGLLQSMLRLGVIGYFVYGALRDALPLISHLSRADLRGASVAVAEALGNLTLRATFGLALLTAADYAWTRFRWESNHRMSKQEVKDEFKQQEGDPRIKAQLRARARQRLKKGLAKQVRASDVVLVNPTHVSVALRYHPKEGAPVVTAKGYDEIALHIRQIAREAKIPVIENRVLARALASRVRVGKAIPVDLYAAVAEILAFVYRLRGRKVVA
jgi:flagellar biosynthetic protein FlhB